jgi:hypothetical protein
MLLSKKRLQLMINKTKLQRLKKKRPQRAKHKIL